jgi:hypothetical protein
MPTLVRNVAVEHLGDYRLRLTFSDGLVRELDFAGVFEKGVFGPLKDVRPFGSVVVDEFAGTIAWPNGVDLDPDVLHGDSVPASGPLAKVLREYHLRATG